MNYILSSILVSAAAACLCSAAADKTTAPAVKLVENYEAAQANLLEDGYAIITYADGWDKLSKKTAHKLLKNSAVREALKNTVTIEYAAPNFWTTPPKDCSAEEAANMRDTNKERQSKLGKLKWVGPHTYPAIILYDKNGRHYATITIPYSERNKAKDIAAKITAAHESLAKQNELLQKAESAQGLEKARLLGQSAVFDNINRPDNIVKRIKDVDPNDKSGYVRRLEFNMHGYAESTAKTKDWRATLKEVEDKIDDKAYSDTQRQGLYATACGLLHRHGSIDDMPKLSRYLREMEKLDPKSIQGVSADHAAVIWIKNLSIADGWSPAVLPYDDKFVDIKGPINIKTAGTYEVTFTYSSGPHQLVIKGVQLFDGNTKIAEDIHEGTTGIKHNKNVYTLTVPARVKSPKLKASFHMPTNRDSNGTISIQQK